MRSALGGGDFELLRPALGHRAALLPRGVHELGVDHIRIEEPGLGEALGDFERASCAGDGTEIAF